MRAVLFCLLFLGGVLSQANASDTTTIAAFGDSLFAGFGLAPEDALPAQLARKLANDGYKVQMLNDGISGDTTAGGVARVDAVLAQKPAAVLVELGANDMLHGLPPGQARDHLDAILSRLHAAKIKLLVIGQRAPLSYGIPYTKAYDAMFCDLAKKYHADCYPFLFDGVYGHPELLQEDGLHPTAEGVKVIVDKIYPQVAKLLTK
jgi:acyl-CoA thioesterase-1